MITREAYKRLKKRQIVIRIIGGILFAVGIFVYMPTILLAAQGYTLFLLAVPAAGSAIVAGLVLFLRSFLHVKYAVLKKSYDALAAEETESVDADPGSTDPGSTDPPGDDSLMLSQFAAQAVYCGSEAHAEKYLRVLRSLGYRDTEARAIFDFECGVLRRYRKDYLLSPDFTASWFFGLNKPFFGEEPKEKPELLRERFFTLGELCKLVDEAEWHWYNSHERELPDAVFAELAAWRLNGGGGEFAGAYFTAVAKELGLPPDALARYTNHEGTHLKKHKWK